nr:hypothetical protein [Tanacetum cinerariifolium]
TVIKNRVEDLQLGVESYRRSINLTKPKLYFEGIDEKIPYTMTGTENEVIQENLIDMLNKNKVGRSNERLKRLDWNDKDVNRSKEMVDKIYQVKKRREQLRRLEECGLSNGVVDPSRSRKVDKLWCHMWAFIGDIIDKGIQGKNQHGIRSDESDQNHSLQFHSSFVKRLSLERELEVNLWNYESRKLLHSIDSGHSANIFCNKFVPETSDELVVTGAADAEVRLFNLSRIRKRGVVESTLNPSARFQCHSRRVKKLATPYTALAGLGMLLLLLLEHLRERDLYMFLVVVLLLVEPGNPSVVWSASEDGTLRQHDFRETTSCSPADSSHRDCRNVLVTDRKTCFFDALCLLFLIG